MSLHKVPLHAVLEYEWDADAMESALKVQVRIGDETVASFDPVRKPVTGWGEVPEKDVQRVIEDTLEPVLTRLFALVTPPPAAG